MINPDLNSSNTDLENILREIEQRQRLKQKTAIPTSLVNELLDSPANWLLCNTFFEVDIKDKERRKLIHKFIERISSIALEDTKELLLEQDYEVDFLQEPPIVYQGFSLWIRAFKKDLYLESIELNCLDFRGLCDCIKLKTYAQLYFEKSHYEASFYCLNLASYSFGAALNAISGGIDFQKKLSEVNRKNSLSYWKPKKKEKEKRKAKYLKILNEKGFTNYTKAANYIHENHNQENRGYRQIYDELREADNEKRT